MTPKQEILPMIVSGFLASLDLPRLISNSSVSRQQFEASQFLARYGSDEQEREHYMNQVRSIADGKPMKKAKAVVPTYDFTADEDEEEELQAVEAEEV